MVEEKDEKTLSDTLDVMARNKKPSKPYRPRDVVRPLNVRDAWACSEGDVHAALLAMESGALDEVHLAHLAAHGDIMRRVHKTGPVHIQAQSIIRMVSIITARPDLHITPSEELPIRAAVKVTLPALMAARNIDILRGAQNALFEREKFGGVRT